MSTTSLAWDDVINVQWLLIRATVPALPTIPIEYTLLMHPVSTAVELV